MLRLVLPALLVVSGPDRDQRDTVELTQGRPIKGRVVLELDDVVYVKSGSRERKFPRARVKSISSVFRNQWQVLDRFAKLEKLTVPAILDLADQCQKAQLVHTERLLCWRALELAPDDEAIHTRLGHKQRKGEWLIPGAGGNLPLAKADEVRSTQDTPWKLRSEHFEVQSSCKLAITVEVLLDLEFFYHYFYQLWQKPVELRELVEPIEVRLYHKPEEFPRISEVSWFVPDDNVVYLLRDKTSERPWKQFYGLTLAIVQNSTASKARARRFPPWLARAWPDYMTTIVCAGAPGRPAFHPEYTSSWHVNEAARSAVSYGIEDVVRFTSDDYSTNGDPKYGRGYMLLHYLVHRTTDAQRAKFHAYLREAVAGKGRFTNFRSIFGKDLEELEADFQKVAASGK